MVKFEIGTILLFTTFMENSFEFSSKLSTAVAIKFSFPTSEDVGVPLRSSPRPLSIALTDNHAGKVELSDLFTFMLNVSLFGPIE